MHRIVEPAGEYPVGFYCMIRLVIVRVLIVAEADGEGATKWGKLKSGAGWISLGCAKKI